MKNLKKKKKNVNLKQQLCFEAEGQEATCQYKGQIPSSTCFCTAYNPKKRFYIFKWLKKAE